jgi:hypothetical protein
VQKKVAAENLQVSMAKVNCSRDKHERWCLSNFEVDGQSINSGFPTMLYFLDGKFIQEYPGSNTEGAFYNYVKKIAESQQKKGILEKSPPVGGFKTSKIPAPQLSEKAGSPRLNKVSPKDESFVKTIRNLIPSKSSFEIKKDSFNPVTALGLLCVGLFIMMCYYRRKLSGYEYEQVKRDLNA